MLKKDITYENPFTNESVTETHYFHISKADLVQMEMEESAQTYTATNGEKLTGMRAKLERIVDSKDGKAIIEEIRDIIRRAYGLKDGDRFRKSSEIWDDFAASEAYSQLIFDLCTDAENAAAFMNGIIPHNLEQVAAEVVAKAEKEKQEKSSTTMDALESASDKLGTGDPTVRVLSEAEMRKMDPGELRAGLADGRYRLS